MVKDEKIAQLEAQKRLIDVAIKQRKKEIGKEKGFVFNKLEELSCEKHPDAIFKFKAPISNSISFKKEKGINQLNIYECGACSEDRTIPEKEKSRAYDCNNCEIVMGDFEIKPYKSTNREGNSFYCKVCDSNLGNHTFMFID